MNDTRKTDETVPNRSSNMEPAEGSRETAEENSRGGNSAGTRDQAGITNRGLERERQEQEQVPDRGKTKSESDRTRSGSEN